MKWQRIETAPKDGTWLILSKWVGHFDHPSALWWITRGHWSTKWNNWNDGVEPCGLADPTHWAHQYDLPKPLEVPIVHWRQINQGKPYEENQMKKLHGQPNEWANNFYRLTENFVYGVTKLDEYRTKLKSMDLERETIEDLLDSMTNPPPVDYSECE